MKTQKFFHKWIANANRRYMLFTGISVGLAFLIPLLGWNPLLLLWIVNWCFCYKETTSGILRLFYAILAVLFGILFVCNLCLHVFALLQYFGYFT